MLGLLKADATIIPRLASILIIISTAAASPASFAPPPPDRSGPSGAAAAHPVVEARASVTNPLTGRKIALGGPTYRRMVLLPPPRPSLRGGGRGGDGVATAGRDGAWIYFDGAMCRIDCCALARWNRGKGTGGDAAAAVPDTIYSVDGGDGSTVRSVDDWEELARYASYCGGEGGILFVNKPPGLLTVPGRGAEKADCLVLRASSRYPLAAAAHRLDRDTSGVLALALDKTSLCWASRQFEERTVQKEYVALVAGHPLEDGGTVDLPIGKRQDEKSGFNRWAIGGEKAREARTEWTVLDRLRCSCRECGGTADYARVLMRPQTGRGQQLRLHMRALGHPMLGDTVHAPHYVAGAAPRLCLHARKLGLAVDDGGTIEGIHPGMDNVGLRCGVEAKRMWVSTPWDPF